MTSSRSTASTSSWVQLALAIVVGCLLLAPTYAHAGRKRVVVLELEGPKAEKFHEDLVKLIKKTHTVVPLEKWTSTAEDLDATSTTDKNIKKVAKKLKIDAVITGKIDKRRDEYLIKLKLREGKTGEPVGNGFDTKAEGPRIDGKASRDLKDELIEAIGNLGTNRSSGGDDEEEEDKPVKKKPVQKDEEEDEEEEEDVKPVKKGFSRKDDDEEDKRFAKRKPVNKDEDEEEEDVKPVKKGFSRKDDEEVAALKTKKDVVEDEEETPLPKATKKKPAKADEEEEDEEGDEDGAKKKVAAKGDDEEEDEDGGSVEEEGEVETSANALSAGERAVDAIVGLSFNARRMSFSYSSDLGPVGNGTGAPPPYKGVPVAGLLVDATVYPLAIGHKRKGIAKNFGATVMVDKVLKINSKAGDPPVTLPTSQMRYAFGVAFRYPLGKLTAAASVRYGRQNFTISPAMGLTPDIPNVNYTIIDPAVALRYQAAPKVLLGLNLGFMILTNTGQIQKGDQYGLATVSGFEGEIGGDYQLTKNIFARAAFKFETIGFKFRGGATKTNLRDGANAPDQDVFGARDSYFGGAVSVGYLY